MQLDKNNIELAEQTTCTGCAACHDVCPTNSINLTYNNNIHSFPYIDSSSCIMCGKCMRVCPSLNPLEATSYKQQYYAAWVKDDLQRMQSTSGGVGTALGKYALSLNYKVCGVCFDSDWNVRHKIIDNLVALDSLRGSKYVQSDLRGVYEGINESLKQGFNVLFIGTPCQVAAVKRTIPQTCKSNLITCEIICHGVNSPKVWSDYRASIEKKYNSPLLFYNFRSKSRGWQSKGGNKNLRVSYKFQNGIVVDEPAEQNQFHYWFGQHFILRESCLHCEYRKEQRVADITIADFWGVQKVIPYADCFKGVSAVITSSEKGEEFLKGVRDIEYIEVDESKTKSLLLGFVEKKNSVQISEEIARARNFREEYMKKGYVAMERTYKHLNVISMFLSKVKYKFRMIYGK